MPCNGRCSGSTPVCKVATNTCVQCTTSAQCPAAKDVCNLATNLCVECVSGTDCSVAKPACNTATNVCVECLNGTTCPSTKPVCDTTAKTCVECLTDNDCGDPAKAQCSGGTCVPCTANAACAHLTDKGICNSGACVQCTVADESPCAGKSCNPATNACTTTAVGSVGTCRACLADSECTGGNQLDPDARCVPMEFQTTPRAGGFCLRRVAKTCVRPYTIPITATSLSGAPSENYCGIDQATTRCEAVLDLSTGQACPDGADSSCGCTRDQNGDCTDPGLGGSCRTVGVFTNQCTYQCGSPNHCPSGFSCGGVATTYCQ